ncbi:uncharacterized protein G2W53_000096 [Senna tora]|uniref:Uncharacterized protein n=1 Tax=Senna tora TaxID=362788 RepID=A0A835CHE0_9FABA|nr:uncharacterized protein G2W53_000096 [Senna tora]
MAERRERKEDRCSFGSGQWDIGESHEYGGL